jgi:NADH-quinone oxidoreductase subunit C
MIETNSDTIDRAAESIRAAIADLGKRFDVELRENPHPGLQFLWIDRRHITVALQILRERHSFRHLAFLTAVDGIECELFRLNYMVHSYDSGADIGLQTEIPREQPVMDSIHLLWAQAATYQRELKEMYGIDFPGSPRVDESFILEGWDNIPPMRRDFDTKRYSEETFYPRPGRETHDTVAHMKNELYPEIDDKPEAGA